MEGSPRSPRRWPALLGVAAAAALAYANALPNEFVWDDTGQVRDNPALRDVRTAARAFGTSYWGAAGGYPPDRHYRPLTTASFVLSWAVSGPSPAAFRAVNVALHAANAALVALLAVELGLAFPWALVAGLLFAVHPVNVEAVAWVVGRAEVAATCCALGALLLWLRGTRARRPALVAAASAALLAGLLFKESAAAAVAVAAAAGFSRAEGRVLSRLRGALLGALPLAGAVAVYFALRFAALGAVRYEDVGFLAAVRGWSAVLLVAKVVARYLALLAAPVTLRAHYDVTDVGVPASPLEPAGLAAVALAAALLAAIAAGLAARRRWAVPGAWAAAGLAPYLHLVPLAWFMAERFLYVASGGVAVAAAMGLERLAARFAPAVPAARAAAAAALVLAVPLGGRTVVRNRDWADEVTFFARMVEQQPRLPGAHLNLGVALVQRGRVEEGTMHLRIAERLGFRPEMTAPRAAGGGAR